MEDKCAFIADETIMNYLVSGDHDKIEKAEWFLNYLAYRKYNKQSYMIPSGYKKIFNILESKDKKSALYFANWFENGNEFIGEAENSEKEDFFSLYETLSFTHENVFLISDKFYKDEEFKKKINVMNMDALDKYIKDKPEFYKHIFERYYDTSSV